MRARSGGSVQDGSSEPGQRGCRTRHVRHSPYSPLTDAKGTTKKKLAPTSAGATVHTPVRLPRTPPITSLTTPTDLALTEQLSLLHLPRPFKNAAYAKNTNRRTKNLKIVLGQERERERTERECRRLAREERERDMAMDVDGVSTTIEEEEDVPTCKLSPVPSW